VQNDELSEEEKSMVENINGLGPKAKSFYPNSPAVNNPIMRLKLYEVFSTAD
jgi:hypothetical protein